MVSVWVRGFVALVLATGLMGVAAPSAEACSYPSPAWAYVYPENGATNIPTNAVLRLVGSGGLGAADPSGVWLYDSLGGEIPLELAVLPQGHNVADTELRVVGGLSPLATYSLVTCGVLAGCEAAAATEVSQFTTGTEADLEPPTFTGATGVVVGAPYLSMTNESSMCGNYAYTSVGFTHGQATDNHEVAGLRLYDVGQTPPRLVGTGSGHLIIHWTSPSDPLPASGASLRPGPYALRAYDQAGNEDLNTQVAIVPEVPVPPYWEPSDGAPPDAGMPDGGASNSDGTGGCQSSQPVGWLWALALGLVTRRVSRSPRRATAAGR